MIQFDKKLASRWERFVIIVMRTNNKVRNLFLIALTAFAVWALVFG